MRPIIKDDTSQSNQVVVKEYDGKTSFQSYVMRIEKTTEEVNFDQESTYFFSNKRGIKVFVSFHLICFQGCALYPNKHFRTLEECDNSFMQTFYR